MWLLRPVQRGLRLGRRHASNSGIIDQPLNVPSGESDLGFQSRISFMSRDNQGSDRIGICGMSRVGFRMFDKSFLYGPIACFPNVAFSWRVLRADLITPESLELFFALRPKLDVVVLGVGSKRNLDAVRKRVVPAFSKHRIGLELMVTEEAITTFNFLNDERRYVGGAFFPQEDLRVTLDQQSESLMLHESADTMTCHPLFSNNSDPINPVRGILNRMYGEGRAEHLIEKVEEIRRLDLELKKTRLEEMVVREVEERQRAEIAGREKYLKSISAPSEDDPKKLPEQ